MKQTQAVPKIIIEKGLLITVNAQKVAKVMQKVGVTEQDIQNTTILFETRKRFATNGMHWPAWFGKRFFFLKPKYGVVKGDVIRITVNKYFGTRSNLSLAKTIAHESVHAAQANRWSMLMWIGHGIILSSTILGVVFGYQLGPWPVVLAIIGGLDGYAIGYQLAPHEHQARTITVGLEDKELEKCVANR